MIASINTLQSEDIKGKKVLVRVDFNVPIKEGKVVDDYRIIRALPTINFLKESGARILLISHIEVKEGEPTLRPVYDYLSERFSLSFIEDCLSKDAREKIEDLKDGEVILFENIRRYEGEKKNDLEFGKALAELADLYVNDAFAVSHRMHASIVGVPKHIPGYAGLLLSDEISHLSIDDQTPRPFLFILGGAKFETKLPLIQKFIDKADRVFVGGALVSDVLKAKGYEVGTSLVSSVPINIDNILSSPKLIFPIDVVCFDGSRRVARDISQVLENEAIVDIDGQTLESLKPEIMNAKYILWNGPLGNYEKGFKEGTLMLSQMIGDSEAISVVGGGDTLASIKELNLEDQFSFISTGGGAMLELLLKGTLPGIEALRRE